MASRAERMVSVSKDSSSSDDEELERCREAVWENQTNKAKDGDGSIKQESRRIVVADHDANQLQVTQGFRKHVAKKLEHLLDSCISETKPVALRCLESRCGDDHNEGFRLFSTSVPGQEAAKPPSPARRRPAPSSSDSDSEMETRLKEAAVSISDLLPLSTHLSSSAEPPSLDVRAKQNKVEEEEEHYVVKKKKKTKQIKENKQDSLCSVYYESECEQEHSVVDVKRKKQKKRKRKTDEEVLN
ncbi:protein CUSTOS [Girardinichthys multiradiatus]|uniref:protein CUSTOS n=1 Tax=Girardinichthys multiradiatus TaxID=208333 RepID=UPI001FAC8F1D|nr:protein CUSTOS [Girardinichthys multiradiatus]